MKTKIAVLISTVMLIACSGCLPLKSKLNIDPATGNVSWGSPKDVAVESIEATINTNGNRSLIVRNWKSSNNPEVLKAAADGNTQMINAVGKVVGDAVQQGVQLYSTMGASAAQGIINKGISDALNKTAATPKPTQIIITNSTPAPTSAP